MNEDQKEFWGITRASILACSGFMISAIGLSLSIWSAFPFIILALPGTVMIYVAIKINGHKVEPAKWRNANIIFHRAFLAFSSISIAISLIYKFKA